MMTSAARVVIVAALPREISQLTKGWDSQAARPVPGGPSMQLATSGKFVAVACGMGALQLQTALNHAAALAPISAVATVGFAGALQADAQVGAVLRPSTAIDLRTGERFTLTGGDGTTIVTGTTVADAKEKARLAVSYGAQCVDMEAAIVARYCVARDLPCYAFKAISDDALFSLPALNRFATPQGGFRTVAFAAHVAMRPGLWSAAMKLGSGAAQASTALTAALRAWIAEQGEQHLS